MSTQLVVAQASKLAGLFNIPESGDLVNVLKATAFARAAIAKATGTASEPA